MDDFDLTGRLTWHLDDANQVLFEAGRTRIRSEDRGGLAYRDHDRDHWSLTHKGQFGAAEIEVSLSQEIGERTTFEREELGAEFAENLRSPQVRNTVLEAKASQAVEWNGQHQMTYGGQFIRTTVRDQNPGAQAHLPPEDRFDQKFSLDQWARFTSRTNGASVTMSR